jgi:hypothetical protein
MDRGEKGTRGRPLRAVPYPLDARECAPGARHDRLRVRASRRHPLLSPLRFPMPRFVRERAFEDALTRINVEIIHLSPTNTAPPRVDQYLLGGHNQMKCDAFAEFEREMLRERTKAGLDAACKEGRVGVRRSKLKPQQQEIVGLVTKGKKTAAAAARLIGVHPATVSRLMQRKQKTA